MTLPSRLFLLTFVLITTLEIVGEVLPNRLLHYAFKPLIMLSLLNWVWQRRTIWQGGRSMRWLLVGMIFALLGDSLLMIREIDLFAPGLGAFLVMQVCYICAFWQEMRINLPVKRASQIAVRAVPFVAYAALFLSYLYTPFQRAPGTDDLWVPVVIYVACIALMAITAAMRRESVLESTYLRVLSGAILFMVSDSVIAINKFIQVVPSASVLIMSTYAAAQYLISTGVTQQASSRLNPEKQLLAGKQSDRQRLSQ